MRNLLMYCFIQTILMGVCVGGWVTPSYGVIPNSDNPAAYSEKQFRLDLLEHNRRTMSQAYLEVGTRDPKWDTLMIEYLDAQAESFSNGGARVMAQVPTTSSRKRIIELTAKAYELGCTDPLVQYVCLINSTDADDRYLRFARRVYSAMLESEYPINRKISVTRRFINVLDKRGLEDEAAEVTDVWLDLFSEAVNDPDFSLEDQRFLFRNYIQPPDRVWLARWGRMCQRINTKNPSNPWLVGALCGSYHVEKAWDLRGSGFAGTVTEEGWRGFNKHLAIAREHLTQAWEHAPQFPEVPARMITASMGQGTGDERVWFERSVMAQFDHYTAYKNYLWSLWPRWGGSFDQMHRFGLECLQTERYDTVVPYLYYRAVQGIASDEGGYRYWKYNNVRDRLYEYYDKQKRVPGAEFTPQEYDSRKAAVSWRLGEYNDALEIIKQLGDNLDGDAFVLFDGDPVLGPSECYARITVPQKVFQDATSHWDDQEYRSASEVFNSALVSMDANDPARPYLKHLSVYGKRQHQENQGVWVDLLDRPDLTGWIVREGSWEADEQGRLIGTTNNYGCKLECRFNTGYHTEVKGTITFLEDPGPSTYTAGVLLAFRMYGFNKVLHRGVLLDRSTNEAESSQNYNFRRRFPADIQKTNSFHIQMWDEHVRLVVNDQLIYEGLKMKSDLPREAFPIAIGGRSSKAGTTIRYDELSIRKLKQRPKWAVDLTQDGGLDPAE